MNWERESLDWPNAKASRFVNSAEARWHVQQSGSGQKVLLLHGSGATTHSHDGLFNQLSLDHEVVAVDLPGHGFTSALRGQDPTLDNVCAALAGLLKEIEFKPDLVAGHSAGAAIAAQMIISGMIAPSRYVAINGAFFPFPGFAGQLFPAAAKMLFLNPLVPSIFSTIASFGQVERVIGSTGSKLTQRQLDFYSRAFCDSTHVHGTLAMMANWDLEQMPCRLKTLKTPTLLIVGDCDGTIDPKTSEEALSLLPNADLRLFKQAGHLVHEERPKEVALAIREFTKECLIK